jgi:hypothetical protein
VGYISPRYSAENRNQTVPTVRFTLVYTANITAQLDNNDMSSNESGMQLTLEGRQAYRMSRYWSPHPADLPVPRFFQHMIRNKKPTYVRGPIDVRDLEMGFSTGAACQFDQVFNVTDEKPPPLPPRPCRLKKRVSKFFPHGLDVYGLDRNPKPQLLRGVRYVFEIEAK